MNEHDEKNELLAAFALGSLSDAEARELAAEVAEDKKLGDEVEAWRETAANLAFAIPAQEPSSAVRENLLAIIRKTPQNSNSENGSPVPQKIGIVEGEKPKKSNVVQFPSRQPQTNFTTYLPYLGAIAASIVAVFLGVSLYNANQNSKSQVAELNQKLTQTEQKLNETNSILERERQEREMLGSPTSAVFALTGTETPNAKARLVFDPKTGKAVLFVEGLPDAPAGKAYQIWWITDPKNPAPGHTFKTGTSGKGELRDQIPQQFIKASIFAVTVEPEGGSPAPTGSIILKSQV